MEYKVKKIIEEVNVLEVTPEEYDMTNDMYKEALILDGYPIQFVKEFELKKIILSDGLHKKEFLLQINPNTLKEREAAAKARKKFLASLDKKADEEQKDILKDGLQ